ncbi:unnamed protein product [Staurois parvus]|uniref:Secreted protein n=1 Tax=Staurois parvus TaxID=386267 RepID=A0ABN9CY33_9NEOB|nr:unnamed protein product [Staurois parvus]
MFMLIRQTEPVVLLHMFSFFFLGRIYMVSTGPISTVQTEVRGFHPPRAERKLLLQALTSALLKSQDCSNC